MNEIEKILKDCEVSLNEWANEDNRKPKETVTAIIDKNKAFEALTQLIQSERRKASDEGYRLAAKRYGHIVKKDIEETFEKYLQSEREEAVRGYMEWLFTDEYGEHKDEIGYLEEYETVKDLTEQYLGGEQE